MKFHKFRFHPKGAHKINLRTSSFHTDQLVVLFNFLIFQKIIKLIVHSLEE